MKKRFKSKIEAKIPFEQIKINNFFSLRNLYLTEIEEDLF